MKLRTCILSACIAVILAIPAAAHPLSTSHNTNSAPIAENLTLTTFKGISIASRFAATDPEGDPVTFQILDSPTRGKITLDEQDTATFWYTPYEGKKGKDQFTYVAVDPHGNVSAPATVKIMIEKQKTAVSYSDMTGHVAAYSALRLAEQGIYVGRRVGDHYCFDPNDSFSREEFLALAMNISNTEPLDGISLTGFYDDETISVWAKGYVSAALMGGTVQGSRNRLGQPVFRGNEDISCAEAAVMIDRLLNIGDVEIKSVLAVPAWAAQSAANLEAVDIVTTDMALDGALTRGEAAMMLSSMLDVIDQRQSKNWLW